MADANTDRPLDLGSLRAAVQALSNAVDVVSSAEFAVADVRWRDTLIAGVVQHFEFRELRNITAHTYARDKALKVAAGAAPLLAHARILLGAIEARNHG